MGEYHGHSRATGFVSMGDGGQMIFNLTSAVSTVRAGCSFTSVKSEANGEGAGRGTISVSDQVGYASTPLPSAMWGGLALIGLVELKTKTSPGGLNRSKNSVAICKYARMQVTPSDKKEGRFFSLSGAKIKSAGHAGPALYFSLMGAFDQTATWRRRLMTAVPARAARD